MKTQKHNPKVKLSSETIIAAVAGDKNAIVEILSAYDPYIKEMSMIKGTNDEGEEILSLDEDLMQQLRLSVLEAILKFKPVIK